MDFGDEMKISVTFNTILVTKVLYLVPNAFWCLNHDFGATFQKSVASPDLVPIARILVVD